VPLGPNTGIGIRYERHNPPHCEYVIEVGDVVAVEVSQEQRPDRPCAGAHGRCPHENSSPAVEQQVPSGRANEGRRTRPTVIRERTTTAENDYLHNPPLIRPARCYGGALAQPR
jgi:hypothetical protein